ncbi:hypothetical protein [uncultured Corynebacterium sp.]|nr:hypothetical protein [uncultured Corynebacterium sp.]
MVTGLRENITRSWYFAGDVVSSNAGGAMGGGLAGAVMSGTDSPGLDC